MADVKCNLRAILNEKSVSIRQLANISGLKFETIRRMYHDQTRRYQRESLAAVCVALHINIDELLTFVDDAGTVKDDER